MLTKTLDTLSMKSMDVMLWFYKKAEYGGKRDYYGKILVVVSVTLWGIGTVFFHFFEIEKNMSESLSGHYYLLEKNRLPEKNDYFVFLLPQNNRFLAGKKLLKIAKATAGDSINTSKHQLKINGEFSGLIKKHLLDGTPMYSIKSQTIPSGYYFAWSPHKDSYDSRYQSVGLIPEKRILGKAYVLF